MLTSIRSVILTAMVVLVLRIGGSLTTATPAGHALATPPSSGGQPA